MAVSFDEFYATPSDAPAGNISYTLSPDTHDFISLDSATRTITVQTNENGNTIASPYAITIIATEDAYGKTGSQTISVNL